MQFLDNLKEFDLILITKVALGTNEAKKITNSDFLLEFKKDASKMMGIVD